MPACSCAFPLVAPDAMRWLANTSFVRQRRYSVLTSCFFLNTATPARSRAFPLVAPDAATLAAHPGWLVQHGGNSVLITSCICCNTACLQLRLPAGAPLSVHTASIVRLRCYSLLSHTMHLPQHCNTCVQPRLPAGGA
jgi:hypothetical protein